MVILGIDPGTATSGFAVIDVNISYSKVNINDYGLIETSKDTLPETRLKEIFDKTNSIIKKYQPDCVVIEKLFFSSNAKTVMRVGQAQGVFLLSASLNNINVFEYAPATIKKIISNNGRADKLLMQKSLRKHLGKSIRKKHGEKTHFDNAADAIAVALCHAIKNEHLSI